MQGYFHHDDPSMPRAAIMGGAIVAVIMSWRDPLVMEMKEWNEMKQWFSNPASQKDDSYEALVERLQNQLQDYFYGASSSSSLLYRDNPELEEYLKKRSAAYVAGDVDIFLQPSPLTRSLASHLARHGVEEDLLQHVTGFMAGFQFCEGDLKRMSTELCEKPIVPTFQRSVRSSTRRPKGVCPLLYHTTFTVMKIMMRII